MEYERGVVSFSRYEKENVIENKYKDRYSWVKSIIIYLIPYQNVTLKGKYLPAKFAYTSDYHKSINEFLTREADKLNLERYEVLVDVNFLNEKVLAKMAGLGSFGKNQLFISKKYGTFCNLGTIITSTALKETEGRVENLCLNCDKCVKNCPTKALENGFIKERCLSNLSQIASSNFELYDNMVLYYGCDACQDACPYNKGDRLVQYDDKAIMNLDILEGISDYKEYAKTKTYNWIGYLKMLRNILVLETNNKNITLEKLKYYQDKYKDTKWFYDHLEYLKKKLGE